MLEADTIPHLSPKTIYLKDYAVPDFKISRVSLDFKLGCDVTLVIATLNIYRNGSHQRALVLDGEKILLKSLTMNGTALSKNQYSVSESQLEVDGVADNFVLEIVTELQPHLNTELSGLYQSSGNFCTQCEAEGFRRITYYPDRPDVLAVFDVKITADKQAFPILLSNGNKDGSGDNPDGTHWAKWNDPHPKPCYLFALVAGDLESISDKFVTASGASVELNIYTQSHNIDKCEHAMHSLKNSMSWDEKVYGREYDLEVYNVVAVDDFNMGAMENKGLNVFNSKYVLANQQTATDSDYEGIESVIGHEYFHNWSGNRVTCRDWFQLSLKEGFTVFRDQEFSADMASRSVKRIKDVQMLRAYQFKEDAGPMAHPIRPDSYQEINNFYTVTIYEKGAEVIRMLHAMMGRDGFRKGTDLYFDTFDGQAVTTEDFVQCIEKANGVDLAQFRHWYTQSGTPEVTLQQTLNGGSLTLKASQSCPSTPSQENKEPFQIPLSIAIFDEHGQKENEQTIVLTKDKQEFSFTPASDQAVVSVLRGFSAPIKLNFEQTGEELAFLVKYEDDGFARWEAMQRLYLNALIPAISTGALNESNYQQVLEALKALIASKPKDKAVLAEMLRLPAPMYLAEQCSLINPLVTAEIRDFLSQRLANDLFTEVMEIYETCRVEGEFSLDGESMANRALRNTALTLLLATQQASIFELAEEQYRLADNMTDRLAAFAGLVHFDAPTKKQVLDDFYDQWKGDPLVMDKWFSIQAMQPTEGALEAVKGLLANKQFSMKNPNKVRSLIGALLGNLRGFHQHDGSAYAFLADTVIELNGINPQVAARLVGSLSGWKRYVEPYASNMRAELNRISQHKGLSKDVSEIVLKALA